MHMRFTAEAVSTSVRYKIPGCEFQSGRRSIRALALFVLVSGYVC